MHILGGACTVVEVHAQSQSCMHSLRSACIVWEVHAQSNSACTVSKVHAQPQKCMHSLRSAYTVWKVPAQPGKCMHSLGSTCTVSEVHAQSQKCMHSLVYYKDCSLWLNFWLKFLIEKTIWFTVGLLKLCLHRRENITCCRCRQQWQFEKMGGFLLKLHRSVKLLDPNRVCEWTLIDKG